MFLRLIPKNVDIDDFFESVTLHFEENFNKNQNAVLFINYLGTINDEKHDKYEEVVGFIKDSYFTLEKEKRLIYFKNILFIINDRF